MNKTLRFTLVSLLMMLCGTVFAGTITFGDLGLTNGTQYSDPFNGGDFTVTFAGGANDGKYYTTGNGIRVYGGGTMTVAAKSGSVTSITVTYDGSNKPSDGTVVNVGTYNAETGEWTGEASSVTFTRPTGSGHWRVQSVTATTTGASVATPTFTPNGGTFVGTTSVEIACETEGATIYYTLDGTDPTAESTEYTAPFTVTETTTVKAIAIKGDDKSSIATATFTAIPSFATLASMTELASDATFNFTGELLVVAKPTDRYVYVKDATGASLIYAYAEKTAAAEVGKTIAANWTGKVSIHNKLFELVPDEALVMKEGDAVAVEYPEVAAADITAENVNKVVTLKGITSYTVDGKNMTITVGETEIAGYNQFGLEIAAAEEGKTYKMVGAISCFKENIQFQPISIEEQAFEPVDCTAKVDVNGWKSEMAGNGVGNYNKDVNQKEHYNGSTTTLLGDVLYQTVEGLDNGTYTVELYANASYTAGRGFASVALNNELGRVVVYAGDVEKTIPVIHQTAVGTNNIVTLENVVVTDGTLKMGLRKDIEGSNWHTIQIKALTQTSDKALADAAAQDEYWKGIAATVAAYEAYKNVGGVEKAAIAAAQTKAAAQAAIAPFYAAKEAYDALAEAIAAAEAKGIDVTDAKAVLAAAETTAEKATEVRHQVKLAVNTKAVEGATDAVPVETNFVVNGTFDTNGVVAPWKATGGFQNQTTANNQTGAFTGNFFENWNGDAKVNKMYQEIEDIPNGKYTLKICAFVNTFDAATQYVFANADHTALTAGEPTAYEVNTIVSGNKIEIGLEQTAAVANWMGIDNVSLLYRGEVNLAELVEAYETALAAAQAVTGNMNAEVKTALDAAIATEVDKTNPDALTAATEALTAATTAATASVNAYAKAAEVLHAMKTFTEDTNLYTAEALNAYYTEWANKYEAKTLTTDEANALQNPNTITGWRAANTVDDLLMSAWDEVPETWNSYHVNTWSTEGDTDGSNFKVPFIEYWIGDGESLAAKTLTATMTDLEAGDYDVTAWVRVRIKNGAEAPAAGITMQVNEGEAVNVADGTQIATSQFYLKEVTATGTVAEDGKLLVKFNVAADNNISWLSFKNVKYVKKAVEVAHTWDFTKWSDETVTNLKAEAAKVEIEDMGEGKTNIKADNGAIWSDHEKAAQTDASKYNTTYAASKDNCFWYVGGEATPTANGTAIAEFEGLEFNTTYGTKRSLAIAVNYPVALSEYAGPSYLWFGGKNSEIMTIKNVKAGTQIKMGVESHKTSEARGVKLFVNVTELTDPEGATVAAPTTYTEQTWQVPAGESVVDVVVKNTNGCHIYFIDAEIDNTTTGITTMNADAQAQGIYNMRGQKVEKAVKGLYIINGKKVVVK